MGEIHNWLKQFFFHNISTITSTTAMWRQNKSEHYPLNKKWGHTVKKEETEEEARLMEAITKDIKFNWCERKRMQGIEGWEGGRWLADWPLTSQEATQTWRKLWWTMRNWLTDWLTNSVPGSLCQNEVPGEGHLHPPLEGQQRLGWVLTVWLRLFLRVITSKCCY